MFTSFKLIARILRSYINFISKLALLLLYFITAFAQQDSIQFDGYGYYAKKCKVILTLQKTDYKITEPILVKAEVINQSQVAYDLHDMFSADYGGIGSFRITNDSGKVWSNLLTFGDLIYIAPPVYLLQPGDTFITAIPINDYGNEIHTWRFPFDQIGYFPVGKNYKAYYSDNNTKSNEIFFNVTNLNKNDSDVITIYDYMNGLITADSAYSLIISKYPNNILTEYVLAEKITAAHHSIYEYQNFFRIYPDSYYMYDEYFMSNYYSSLFKGYFVPWKKIIKGIVDSNISVQLKDYLNKRNTLKRIKYLVNGYSQRKNYTIIANPEYWR